MERTSSEPVFNLNECDLGRSFFSGRRAMLIHDNSLVEPVLQPFDALPDLAAIVELPANNRLRRLSRS
jgi:hypothetical protein